MVIDCRQGRWKSCVLVIFCFTGYWSFTVALALKLVMYVKFYSPHDAAIRSILERGMNQLFVDLPPRIPKLFRIQRICDVAMQFAWRSMVQGSETVREELAGFGRIGSAVVIREVFGDGYLDDSSLE